MEDRSKVPELFKEIMRHDNLRPSGSVVTLSYFKDWRERRRELTRAAENFIQRQRGGNNGVAH